MRILLSCCALLVAASVAHAQNLQQLKYNHPGLAVDLGLGLWAWPIPWDVDGDGDFDLIVSCPDKPSNGVWFFENPTGDTKKNKLPVFKPAKKISGTVHYVMPSYVQGEMRVLVPGAEFLEFTRKGTDDRKPFGLGKTFYKPVGDQPKGPKVRHNQWRFVDYNGDDKLDLVIAIEDWSDYGWDDAYNAKGEWINGPLHGFVFVAIAKEDGKFADPIRVEADGKPIDVYGCPSPNFADWDGDGDLDLICGEFLDGFTYFENTGTRKEPKYAAGRRLKDAKGQPLTMDLQMIVPVAFDWDKDGDNDLIVGDEDGRVAFVENTGKFDKDRMPIFAAPAYFQQEADTLKCGALATPVCVDWDGDGDQDILSGNTAGYIEFFENLSGSKVANPKWAAPKRLEVDGKPFRIMAGPNRSIQGPAEAKWGYTTFSVADWDGDGLPDIVLNSILGDVVWLKNIGTRKQPKLSAPQPIEVQWAKENLQPELAWGWWKPKGNALLTQWRTTPVVYDFNGDGLPDLAILDTEGYLAFFERAKLDGKLVLLPPRRAFVFENGIPLRLNANPAGKSGRRKLCETDWNGDGKFDFLLNSSNADLMQQVEFRKGTKDNPGVWVFKNAGTLAKQNIEGHDVSPAVSDFDFDGVPDFLGGAEDGRFYVMKNPRGTK